MRGEYKYEFQYNLFNQCIHNWFSFPFSFSFPFLFPLSFRQACAIESAALWNPGRGVFVTVLSQIGLSRGTNSPIIEALQSYPNVHFRNVNFQEHIAGTPGEEFFKTGEIFNSVYFKVHIADFTRYVTLYRFGGIYLDLDVVVQKGFDNFPPDFAGKSNFKSKFLESLPLIYDNDQVAKMKFM